METGLRPIALRPGRRRHHRWAIWLLLPLLAGLIAGWLAFQHIPAWYTPVVVQSAELTRVRNDVVVQQDRFNGMLNASPGPFQFWLSSRQLNEWLAAREEIWPLSRRWLPASLSDPCVVLEPGAIRVAATYRSGSLATIVSARLRVEGRRDGIWVKLDAIQLGSLPIPASTAREWLERLDAGPWPAGRVSKYQNLREPIPPLANLLKPDGARLPNSFVWMIEPKRPFWIYELRVRPDAILATIEPLPRGQRAP